MIQRIQTLLLLIIGIAMAMMPFTNIWGELDRTNDQLRLLSGFKLELIDTAGTLNDKSDDTVVKTEAKWFIGGLAFVASIVAFISIFSFKNRLTQMKLGALNALIMAATLGISFYTIYRNEPLIEGQGSITTGFYLPAAAMILNILANRFIRKDEKLVKSVDRIR
ncbi:DUF4293 domain-containing protein [Roseivirga sp. UBA838]|uniref:DUF4293 domain-containing protein n=1 Tax=Roseivirga sp. UBA838 TaxID=1947393 RepID=UPI00257AF549|nr:DUF4293 domain-containing protein [Roseivirga sp. UBA838]|tara:strand:+ start:64368 stop:64862 length:495 start_codon:yes stop_codon:yes gene_type:complete